MTATGNSHEDMARDRRFGAGIAGIGMCVPDRVLTNDDLAGMVDTTDEWILSRTGIRERRICDADTCTSDLSIQAARRALSDAGVKPEEVDVLICATATGDYVWPATSCIVQDAIGAVNAGAFDLSAACSGFCYGCGVADGLIHSGVARTVLVVGADTLSKHVDWTDRSTCILFGDGAGAAVFTRCEAGSGVITSVMGADGGRVKSVWLPAGGVRRRVDQEAIDNKLDRLTMAGAEVYKFAVVRVPETIQQALDKACIKPSDVDLLVMHQANIRIINSAADRLGIDPDRVFINVDRYGNTSAASIPIALVEACNQGRLKPGDIVATCGFGAGLTWGANLIRWTRPAGACAQ